MKDELKQAILAKNFSIVFIRHGRTPWSLDQLMDGPKSFPLTEQGIKETEIMAEKFQSLFKDCVVLYASPLERTMQSATIYQYHTGLPITIVDGIQERCYGDYSTLSRDEVDQGVKPDDQEVDEIFESRVMNAIAEVIQAHNDHSTIALVSHSGVFKFFSEWLSGEIQKLDFSELSVFHPDPENKTYTLKIYGLSDDPKSSAKLS